uniref:Nitro_FeMo-Co domain-containing protein n=1 Tax=Steinernema glaseri TaxID=37863 RepID=A0A1I7YBR6_9BILA
MVCVELSALTGTFTRVQYSVSGQTTLAHTAKSFLDGSHVLARTLFPALGARDAVAVVVADKSISALAEGLGVLNEGFVDGDKVEHLKRENRIDFVKW